MSYGRFPHEVIIIEYTPYSNGGVDNTGSCFLAGENSNCTDMGGVLLLKVI
jgi:hypothetical protein